MQLAKTGPSAVAIRSWVAKANPAREWEWDLYFEDRDPSACEWDWVRCRKSMSYIRDGIRENDVIVCYRTDTREIVGFTLAAGPGRPKDDYWILDLVDPCGPTCLRLHNPVTVSDLRERRVDPRCFRVGAGRSIRPISDNELRGILQIAATANPEQNQEIWDWFERVRVLQHSR
jgi:hypothetical protein